MSKWIEQWGCERCSKPVYQQEDRLCLACERDGWRQCTNGGACLALDVKCEPYDEQTPVWVTVDGVVWWHWPQSGGRVDDHPCPVCTEDEWVKAYSDPAFPADRGLELFQTTRGIGRSGEKLKDKTKWREFFLSMPDGWKLTAIKDPWSDAPEFKVKYRPDLYDWSYHSSFAATVVLKGGIPTFGRGSQLWYRASIDPAGSDSSFGADDALALLALLQGDAELDAKRMEREKASDERKRAADAEREANPQPKPLPAWPGEVTS